jgi:rhodanese-related sulfurtransferase
MKTTHLLISLLSLMLVGMLHAADAKADKKYKNVSAEEFDKLRTDKKNVVLDVRTPEEYADGHIPGSINIDFNSEDFDKQVAKLDKDKTYLVHCAAGGRSARSCSKMSKMNFEHLYNLEGGMGAWEKAGKPVGKKK